MTVRRRIGRCINFVLFVVISVKVETVLIVNFTVICFVSKLTHFAPSYR